MVKLTRSTSTQLSSNRLADTETGSPNLNPSGTEPLRSFRDERFGALAARPQSNDVRPRADSATSLSGSSMVRRGLVKLGMQDTPGSNARGLSPGDLYYAPSFASRSILQYAEALLRVPADKVSETLFDALPEDCKTAEHATTNRQLLERAMGLSVNASGAAMMMVHTEVGLFLVAANSQRRKLNIQTNGACEKGESIGQAIRREFVEELGNPPDGGILLGTLAVTNLRAMNTVNRIGTSAAEIAKRIVDKEANQGDLYLNVSCLYVNRHPVSLAALQQEVSILNERLLRAKPFYKEAVRVVYGDHSQDLAPLDLNDEHARLHAVDVVRRFKETCPDIITANFAACFEAPELRDAAAVKHAVNAIIDLSENDEIRLLDESSVASAMDLHISDPEALEHEYFEAPFDSSKLHQGDLTPAAFMALLKSGANAHGVGEPLGAQGDGDTSMQ